MLVGGEVRQLISPKTPNWDSSGNFLHLGTWVQLDLVYLVSALIALTPLIELTPLIALTAN